MCQFQGLALEAQEILYPDHWKIITDVQALRAHVGNTKKQNMRKQADPKMVQLIAVVSVRS